MVMAVGLGGPTPAMFHLTTHAFFKALLFLGAGSVIIALHHEQNIWKMGALRKKMPVTFWTFMVGTLALCGVWPFSGFYSKDSILAQALETNHIALFVLGVVVAMLTTFYMFRLVFVVFFGGERSEAAGPRARIARHHVVAVADTGGVQRDWRVHRHSRTSMRQQFEPATERRPRGFGQQLLAPFNASPLAALFGLCAVIFGFFMACALYCEHAERSAAGKAGLAVAGDAEPVLLRRTLRARAHSLHAGSAGQNCRLALTAGSSPGLPCAGHTGHGIVRARVAPVADRQPPDLRLPARGGRGAGALFRAWPDEPCRITVNSTLSWLAVAGGAAALRWCRAIIASSCAWSRCRPRSLSCCWR